jgi:hypothetical protein
LGNVIQSPSGLGPLTGKILNLTRTPDFAETILRDHSDREGEGFSTTMPVIGTVNRKLSMADNPYTSPTTETEVSRSWPRLVTFFILALFAVVVWPLLGIVVSDPMFDNNSEAVLLFGGLTALLLLPLYVFVDLSENGFEITIIVIWILSWIVPYVWYASHPRSRPSEILFLAITSAISFAQAGIGFLMILGKEL